MRRSVKAFSVLLALCLLSAVAALPAQAGHIQLGTFAGAGEGPGGSGSGDGQLSNPGQIDVLGFNGRIYVADTANNRVQAFLPNATGGTYYAQTPIAEPTGLAVDQASGAVYVANASGISKFAPTLAAAEGWTDPSVSGALAVDPTSGDLLVADRDAGLVRRFEADGTAAGSFAAERPLDLAVDSSGEIFVITSTGEIYGYPCGGASSAVERFDAAGVSQGTLGSFDTPGAIAIDPSNDSIAVATHVNEYFCEAGSSPEVALLDASGTPLETVKLSSDTYYAMVPGLAFDGQSSRLYAVTKSPGNDTFGPTKAIAFEILPPPVAPAVLSSAAAPSYTEATLRAEIDRGYDAVSYRFEYGPTAAYGLTTPERTIPIGRDPVRVKEIVGGFQPGSTYHFRVVVQNSVETVFGPDRTLTTAIHPAVADSCPNAAIRAKQGAGALPRCRAYELVSPADKAGGIVAAMPANGAAQSIVSAVAPDGNSATFWSYQGFGDAESSTQNSYLARRGPGGWASNAVAPALPDRPNLYRNKVLAYGATPDLSTFFLYTGQNFDPLDQRPSLGGAESARDVYSITPGGQPTWISRPNGNVPATAEAESAFVAATPDGSHVYFQSPEAIVPAAEGQVGGANLYVRVNGETKMVGLDSGNPLSACGSVLGTFNRTGVEGQVNTFYGKEASVDGAASDDGSRVYFGAPDPSGRIFSADPACDVPTQIYLREGNGVVDVSRSQRSVPDPSPSAASFQGAARDGSVAYFLSNAALTDDADLSDNAMLYMYDAASEDLTLVSPEGGVLGVTVVSPDGSHVYYVRSLPSGGYDLVDYTRDAGNRTVAHLEGLVKPGGFNAEQGSLLDGAAYAAASVTPDGEHLLFQARTNLTDYDSEAFAELYLYEAATGDVVCVSCNPTGAPPEGNGAALRTEGDSSFVPGYPRSRNLLGDGSRAFFETTNPLVAADRNGASDVYEWDQGRLALLSDGRDDRGSYFFGASADGRDVFFTTKAEVLAQDYDNGDVDIYDARAGGGFPMTPTAPGCVGEACQGAAAAPSRGAVPGSATASGPESKPRKRVQQKKKKKRSAAKRRAKAKKAAKQRAASKNRGVAK